MTRGRAARLAALPFLFAAGCRQSPPPGIERLAGTADAHDLAVPADADRALFLEFSYPHKTYLGATDAAAGPDSFRVAGYALGAPLLALDGGRRALVGVQDLRNRDTGEDSEYDAPPATRLLYVDVAGRRAGEEVIFPNADRLVALASPAWSPRPIAVWSVKGEVMKWSPLPEKGPLTPKMLPEDFSAPLLLGDRPWAAGFLEGQKKRRLGIYDFSRGKLGPAVPVPANTTLLRASDDTLLFSRWNAEDERYELVRLDAGSGATKLLWTSTAAVEDAIEGPAGLFAVTPDSSRKPDPIRAWMSPRRLIKIDAQGAAEWTMPWVSRPGHFLPSGERKDALRFAVTDKDQPGVWIIPADRASLASAVPAIDGRPSRAKALFDAVFSNYLRLAGEIFGVLLAVALIRLWNSQD